MAAGWLLALGSAAMVLGALLSWNLFRVGNHHFYGRVVLSGVRLALLLLGISAAFQARRVLTGKVSPGHQRGYWASVVVTGSLPLALLSQYAVGIQKSLERWVVGTYAATLASHDGISLPLERSNLRDSIARGDLYLTLRPGFFFALAGASLILVAAAALFVEARRSRPAPAQPEDRVPRSGLRNVLAE